MDNHFNQPGGVPGQGIPGQQPWPSADYTGGAPAQPYGGAPAYGAGPYGPSAPASPYDAMRPAQPYGGPTYGAMQPPVQPNPYDTMQQAAVPNPYDTMAQPNPYSTMGQPNPYDTMQQAAQPAYGTVQQPYADPGAMQAPYSADGYQHLFGQEQPGQPVQQPVQPHGQPFAGAAVPQNGPARKRLPPSDIALIVVAMLAVIGFAGWYLYATYAPEAAPYGEVATGSLSAIHSGSVLVVRNEIPYDLEGVNSVVYSAREGSSVTRNAVICQVYSTGYSASAVRQLQEYRDEIRDYQEQLIESSTLYDAKSERYNGDVLTLAQQVRSLVAGADGSLPNLESQLTQTVAARQEYFDQKYASDQRFSRMKDDERSQLQRISSWTLPQKANSDALVSFYSDGYEYAITGNTYAGYEPDQVRQMIEGVKPANATPPKGRTTVYRLVKNNEWYALFLSNDTEWNPVVGETYELQLERFGNTPVTASVVSFTKAGGELLVRLRIVGSVEQVMYLRSCDAVLSESVTTLMVNERAIYMQDEMTGVVVVEGSTESFIPVNVLHVVDGNAYFQTIQQGLLFEGMTVKLFD